MPNRNQELHEQKCPKIFRPANKLSQNISPFMQWVLLSSKNIWLWILFKTFHKANSCDVWKITNNLPNCNPTSLLWKIPKLLKTCLIISANNWHTQVFNIHYLPHNHFSGIFLQVLTYIHCNYHFSYWHIM